MDIGNLNYIIFNNRSQELVSNFLPKLDVKKLISVESKFRFVNTLFKHPYDVNIDENDLNMNYKDIVYTLDDIKGLKDKILSSNKVIKDSKEYDTLKARNISDSLIDKYKIASLSYGWTKEELDILGFSLHPLLTNILQIQTTCGIIIPYFNKDGDMINAAIRRFENGPLKYTLSVPDVDIFGVDDIEDGSELWICEGIFDCMALRSLGLNAITVSSASWSTIQLYKLLEKKPTLVNIFSDYDYTGLKTSAIMTKFLNINGIESKTWISNCCKDAAEHIFEKGHDMDKVEQTIVTKYQLEELEPMEQERKKDYMQYLKTREI
jgi:hypothetical protein